MAVKKSVEIAINPPNFQMVELEVEGLTPMIQNKMKEATIQAMEDARMGKAKKNNRAPIDPKVEYLKSTAQLTKKEFKILVDEVIIWAAKTFSINLPNE